MPHFIRADRMDGGWFFFWWDRSLGEDGVPRDAVQILYIHFVIVHLSYHQPRIITYSFLSSYHIHHHRIVLYPNLTKVSCPNKLNSTLTIRKWPPIFTACIKQIVWSQVDESYGRMSWLIDREREILLHFPAILYRSCWSSRYQLQAPVRTNQTGVLVTGY